MKYSVFSNKFDPDSGILQLMNDLGNAANESQAVKMLGGGNPASIPQMEEYFRSEMHDLLAQGRKFENMVGKYDSPQGNTNFIDGLAELLQSEFGWPITARNIAITNGSQASFGIIFNLFSGRFPDGSEKKIVLPMTPEYIGYSDVGLNEHNIFQANRPIIDYNDLADSRFFKYRVDFDHLDIGTDCGAVCISRPTNPTGNVITDKELGKLNALTQKADVPLIIDGAYGLPFPAIIFNDAKPIWDSNIILCLSLSKLGLPGVRTGIVIADQSLIEMLKSSNAVFNLAPGRFGPSLISNLVWEKKLIKLCADTITPYYKHRVDLAVDLIHSLMVDIPVRIHKPEGSIFLWLWFEDMPISAEVLYHRLKKRGVYIIAGHHFFPGLSEQWQHKHQCIRVSYAGDSEQLAQGIQIIAEEVRLAYH